ncbi:MAG: homoserine kinase [Conexivisphaerales archaeon]
MLKRVVARAPASSANLGGGFDIMAVALEGFYDQVEVERTEGAEIEIVMKGKSEGIPSDFRKNAAGAVAFSILKKFNIDSGLRITVKKGVPVGVGLGSSGASSAATALAMNRLFELGLEKGGLVVYASQGELTVSGAAHRDNVAASLLGGFVLLDTKSETVFSWKRFPSGLKVCIAIPSLKLAERKTEYSRSVLPKTVSLDDMVDATAASALVAAGIVAGDIEIVGKGMMNSIVDMARSKIVQGFKDVRDAAVEEGANGVCLSGAGPSIIALVDERRGNAEKVVNAMVEAFKKRGIEARGLVTKIGRGAKVVFAE